MDRTAPKLDKNFMSAQTRMARLRVDSTLEQARALLEDTDKAARLERHFCKNCHYGRRLAQQAFTKQPCACCHEEQQYSTSATDVLCLPCAQENSLCKRCAGDLEMDQARDTWPTPAPAPQEPSSAA